MRGFESGQALVVVLLILGMAVTVGLSIVARSVTEVAVSTAEDESVRALEAAEAGVERALGGGNCHKWRGDFAGNRCYV